MTQVTKVPAFPEEVFSSQHQCQVIRTTYNPDPGYLKL